MHLGSLTSFVPGILARYGAERLGPGDAVVCNDGYRSGGVHLNDVCVLAPVHDGDDHLGYVATLAHHVDVGGGMPGSMGVARELFGEGLIIPPTLLVRGGVIEPEILGLVLANVRSPRETGGDLRAQIAGVHIGTQRLRELADRFGRAPLVQAMGELLDYTERRVRRAIAEMPHGSFAAEGFLDDDGVGDDPVRIVVRVTLSPDGIVYDLTGSAPQQRGSVNATYAMTLSNCAYSLRCLLDPDLPMNDGFYRVVEVVAPPGTVVNARDPAPICGGWETGFRISETAFQALGQAMPERITAGSKGCLCNIAFGGADPRTGEYFTFYETIGGGYGARAAKDGIDAIQPHGQNTENSPVEETEANYPVRILRYELRPDSEGAGRQRGGLGIRRDYTFAGSVRFSVLSDRAKFPPWGLAGGGDALPARYVRNPDGPAPVEHGSKFSLELEPGEVFSVQMGGGGGYGDARERDPARVAEDVRAGKVSPARAADVYGAPRVS
jgi:N-methylhydantoinase B